MHNKADIVAALGKISAPSSDFDLNAGLGAIAPTREAGVLVPIFNGQMGPELILTKRAAHLKAHPGQISFPGGRMDESDPNIEFTALREAWEEIALPSDQVEILGTLGSHDTVTAYKMTPVVGWIEKPWDVILSEGEVAELFTVPLSHVLDLTQFQTEGRRWRGVRREYYVVPYGPYYIWGATARILRGFADRFR